MSTPDIPVNVEVSNISSDLNSIILFVFLMGMYTVVYFGAIYVYFTRNPFKHYPVPTAMTILYLITITYTALQWNLTKFQFIDNGGTRQSVFLDLFFYPQWMNIAFNTLTCVTFVIADGLLIWRCFYVWNSSLRIISVSLFLLVTELTLFLVQIAFDIKYSTLLVSAAMGARLNALFAAAYFMSFGTTLVTTSLIAYRIYSVSKQQGASSRRFKHVIDIVVQSGAVYAVSQLVTAIPFFTPSSVTSNTREMALTFYSENLSIVIAGISPTIMVARVALLSPDTTYPSTSVHLSGLQFHMRSTHPTVNIETMDMTHSPNSDRTLAGEGQAVEGKVQ